MSKEKKGNLFNASARDGVEYRKAKLWEILLGSSSGGAAIAGACVALVGYTNSEPQMGDEVTWPIFWMTMFLVFGLPILGWLCNIVAMKFYTLDKERMVEVQKNLAARKAAGSGGETAK